MCSENSRTYLNNHLKHQSLLKNTIVEIRKSEQFLRSCNVSMSGRKWKSFTTLLQLEKINLYLMQRKFLVLKSLLHGVKTNSKN